MKTVKQIQEEKVQQMNKWVEQNIKAGTKSRVTFYNDLRKVSVEVYSPIANKWYNVHTENI